MPELPDLQVFSYNLNRYQKGKSLEQVTLNKNIKLIVPAVKLKKALQGQKLVKVYREGKQLRFAFQNKNILSIHLMLHGKLSWIEGEDKQKHVLAELIFSGGKGIALTDFQRNARLILNPEKSDAP